MKLLVFALLVCGLLARPLRAEEPLMPAPLNEVLRQVAPRMPLAELKALLAKAYPTVAESSSNASGGSGNQGYRLDARYDVSVATLVQDGVYVVHPALCFAIVDRDLEQRVTCTRAGWRDNEAHRKGFEFSQALNPNVFDEPPRFSKGFYDAKQAAEKEVNEKRDAAPLLALLPRFSQQAEQAQLEVAIGLVYNQRTGMVDPAKAVEHFTKALALGLPAKQRYQVLVWRAGSYEQLKQHAAALADELRVLLRCAYYDLSGPYPKRPGGTTVAYGKAPKDAQAVTDLDEHLAREASLLEEDLQKDRYFCVEAVKRLQKSGKLSDDDVLKQLAILTADRRKDETILRWVHGPNPRPWP